MERIPTIRRPPLLKYGEARERTASWSKNSWVADGLEVMSWVTWGITALAFLGQIVTLATAEDVEALVLVPVSIATAFSGALIGLLVRGLAEVVRYVKVAAMMAATTAEAIHVATPPEAT